MSREQLAALLLLALEDPGFVPPACVPPGPFADVPCSSAFARFIQELASRGITTGCGNGRYCPENAITREQSAVLLLKALGGVTLQPCTGRFADVACSSPYAQWIEELARRGITAGCTPSAYCPAEPLTRAQMAVFLVRAFGLPL